ncbi:hypothetical protein [Natrinema gari]|uniref:Uncharacterized protein n=1 Tax=Natrinema gari JCM 14663 TaxID=1230459 RepID=L9ZJS0_9EURY|nr:hypothetical protein [Natrinema gari]ELY85418.1 hypothetical protein C486_00065 [Natrinema gari JCM 14663]
MGETIRFTPLHPQDYDYIEVERNSYGTGVKITDPEGLEDDASDTLVEQMDTREYVDRSEYPGWEWSLLLGFTTYGGGNESDDPFSGADYHNVANTSPADMADIFATVSEYTEPFVVWMGDIEGWPHPARLEGGDGDFFRVEAADGDIDVERLTPGIVDREPAGFGGETNEWQ